MKSSTISPLAALLLLLTFSVAIAAELPAVPAAHEKAPAAAAEPAAAPAAECPAASPFFTAAFESSDASLAAGLCGPCSGQCAGKQRGAQCVIPPPNGGFGNCNIYQADRCEEGGWACSCGRGPLP